MGERKGGEGGGGAESGQKGGVMEGRKEGVANRGGPNGEGVQTR